VRYSPQYIWLKEELARVDREKTPWLFVIVHKPLYSSNVAHYMEGEAMRSVFESWFVQYKVDAVFAGHVHAYERSVCFSSLSAQFFCSHPLHHNTLLYTLSSYAMVSITRWYTVLKFCVLLSVSLLQHRLQHNRR